MQALHTLILIAILPLKHFYKILIKSSQAGTHSFRGSSLLSLPLTGKAIKLFFILHQKLCLQDSIWRQCTEAKFTASRLRGDPYTELIPLLGQFKVFISAECLDSALHTVQLIHT